MFAGVFCFADGIALLAPCASALRKMLSICSSYAASHGLIFNSEKDSTHKNMLMDSFSYHRLL